jgi:hypothetical protein
MRGVGWRLKVDVVIARQTSGSWWLALHHAAAQVWIKSCQPCSVGHPGRLVTKITSKSVGLYNQEL